MVAGGVEALRARVNAFTIDFYSILSWRDVLGFVHAAEKIIPSRITGWIIKKKRRITEGAFRDREKKKFLLSPSSLILRLTCNILKYKRRISSGALHRVFCSA